jgi:hypothetical protein
MPSAVIGPLNMKDADQPQAEFSTRQSAPGGSVKFTSPKPSLANGGTWPKPAVHRVLVSARFRCIAVLIIVKIECLL